MKVTRGAIGIVCATIALVAISVKTQSNRPPFGAAVTEETAESGRVATNSASPVVNTDDLPGLYGSDIETPKPEVRRPQANAPANYVPENTPSDEPGAPADPAYDEPADDTAVMADEDESANYVMDDPAPAATSAFQLTDREMLDRLMAEMDPDEQRNFRATWVMMSPQERQDFLSTLRG